MKQIVTRNLFDYCAGYLDRRGACTHNADPLALEGYAVISACAVKAGTAERVEAPDIGKSRMVQETGRGNDDIGNVFAIA